MSVENIGEEWKITQRPPSLSRSFQFETYDEMRQFLDDLADISEQEDFYPNINFTRTRVNVTIQSDADELGSREINFAEQAGALLSKRVA